MLNFSKEEKKVYEYPENSIKCGYRSINFLTPFEVGVTANGNDYITIMSNNKEGNSVKNDLFLSEKAVVKLKNLYYQLFGKQLEGNFETTQELAEFLTKEYDTKYTEKSYFNTRLDGEIFNDIIYPTLPFKIAFNKSSLFVEKDFTERETKIFIKGA